MLSSHELRSHRAQVQPHTMYKDSENRFIIQHVTMPIINTNTMSHRQDNQPHDSHETLPTITTNATPHIDLHTGGYHMSSTGIGTK